jgi:glutathione synthase/RimK-type ligase-like ATP-grasp enzyme
MNKIKTPKLIAYYNHNKNKIEKYDEPRNDKIIIKPIEGYWGKEIKIVNSDSLISSLKKCNKSSIAEEYIQQHHLVNDIFDGTVNSIRILTLKKNGEIIVIKGTLKVGRDPDIIVDNVAKGGIGINLNLETGILGNGYTSYKHGFIEYKSHPITNYKFFGKTIPYINEVKDLAINAHRYFSNFKLIGWDIAITDTGPTIVEGNVYPNITGMQLHEPLRTKLI